MLRLPFRGTFDVNLKFPFGLSYKQFYFTDPQLDDCDLIMLQKEETPI